MKCHSQGSLRLTGGGSVWVGWRRMVGYNISMRKAVEGSSPSSRQLPLYHKVSPPPSHQVQSPAPSTAQMERISGLISTSKHTRTIHITSVPPQPTQQHWQHNLDIQTHHFGHNQYTHVGQYGQRQQAVTPRDAVKIAECLKNIMEDRILTALTAIRDHTPTRPLRQRIPTHYNNTPLELTESLEKLDSEYVARAGPSRAQKEGANMLKGWVEFHYLMQVSGVMRTLQKMTPVLAPQDQSLNNTNHQILDHHWHADYSPMNEVSLDHFPPQQEGGQSLVYTVEREDKKQLTISTQSKFPNSAKALPLSNRDSAIETVEHQKEASRSSQQSHDLRSSPALLSPNIPPSQVRIRQQKPFVTQCFTYEHLLPSDEPAKSTDYLNQSARPDQPSEGALLMNEILTREGLRRDQRWKGAGTHIRLEHEKEAQRIQRHPQGHSPPPVIHINTKPNSPLVRPPTHKPEGIQPHQGYRFGPSPTNPPPQAQHRPQPVQMRPNSPPTNQRGKMAIVVTPPKRQPEYLSPPTHRQPIAQTQPPSMWPQAASPVPMQRGVKTIHHQQPPQRTIVGSPGTQYNRRMPSHVSPFTMRQEEKHQRPMSPLGGEYQLFQPTNSHKVIPRPQSPVVKGPQWAVNEHNSPRHQLPMQQQVAVSRGGTEIKQHQQVRQEYFGEGVGQQTSFGVKGAATARPPSIMQTDRYRPQELPLRPTSPLPNMHPPPQRHNSLANHGLRPFTPAPPPNAPPTQAQPAVQSQRWIGEVGSGSSSKLSRPQSMGSKLSVTLRAGRP